MEIKLENNESDEDVDENEQNKNKIVNMVINNISKEPFINKIKLLSKSNKIKDSLNDEEDNEENNYLFIEYKNIYIGGLSINNILKRKKFGLNIYSNESFYIGRWESNMKEGIGFLKINENLMYIGNFNSNQFNGFGILYDKIRKIFS